ncbi:hypothetical protein BHE74_00032905, partial [Ensete ventricosum]
KCPSSSSSLSVSSPSPLPLRRWRAPPLCELAAGGHCSCGLTAGSRSLRPGRGWALPLRVPRYKRPCPQAPTAHAGWPQPAAPCAGGLGCSQSHLCRGPWPKSVATVGGLAVASQPLSSSLRLLRKCSKNT